MRSLSRLILLTGALIVGYSLHFVLNPFVQVPKPRLAALAVT
jgi:hypothetical protein